MGLLDEKNAHIRSGPSAQAPLLSAAPSVAASQNAAIAAANATEAMRQAEARAAVVTASSPVASNSRAWRKDALAAELDRATVDATSHAAMMVSSNASRKSVARKKDLEERRRKQVALQNITPSRFGGHLQERTTSELTGLSGRRAAMSASESQSHSVKAPSGGKRHRSQPDAVRDHPSGGGVVHSVAVSRMVGLKAGARTATRTPHPRRNVP